MIPKFLLSKKTLSMGTADGADRRDASPSPPPSYVTSAEASSTSELLKLQLRGDSILIQGTETAVYELTQAPLAGTGASLGISRVSSSASRRLLYVAKPVTVGRYKDLGIWSIESQGGREPYSHGASLVYGKWSKFFGRYGTTWNVGWRTEGKNFALTMNLKGKNDEMVWSDDTGEVVAVGSFDSDETVSLEFTKAINTRTVLLIITAWCTIIWQANQYRREKANKKQYNLFAPNYSKTPSSQKYVRKPYGVWIPSRYL